MNIQSVSYVNIDDFGFEDNFLSEALDHLDASFGDAQYTLIRADEVIDAINSYNDCLEDDMLCDGVNHIAYEKLFKLPADVFVNLEN